MSDGAENGRKVTGGCRYGTIRIASGPPREHSRCRCRMCRRATGNAYAPLAEGARHRVAWHGRASAMQAPSPPAECEFSATCGSPIFYRGTWRDTMGFMAGIPQLPFAFDPIHHDDIESRIAWPPHLDALPARKTASRAGETRISCQAGER